MRPEPSILRAGGLAAFGVALAYFASGICALLMPPELQGRPDVTPHQFWTVLSRDPSAHLAFHWSWVAAGLFGLGAVPAISLLVWHVNPGAVLWSGAAAFSGFGVLARSHLMEVAFDRKVIPLYPHAEPAFQEAVHVVAGLALDVPDGFLTYGAIGVWVAVVSMLARRRRVLPRAALCARASRRRSRTRRACWATPSSSGRCSSCPSGLGGLVLAPAWYAWLGVVLRRRARQSRRLPATDKVVSAHSTISTSVPTATASKSATTSVVPHADAAVRVRRAHRLVVRRAVDVDVARQRVDLAAAVPPLLEPVEPEDAREDPVPSRIRRAQLGGVDLPRRLPPDEHRVDRRARADHLPDRVPSARGLLAPEAFPRPLDRRRDGEAREHLRVLEEYRAPGPRGGRAASDRCTAAIVYVAARRVPNVAFAHPSYRPRRRDSAPPVATSGAGLVAPPGFRGWHGPCGGRGLKRKEEP